MKKIALTDSAKKILKPALWGNAEKSVFSEIQAGSAGLYITDNRQMLAVLRLENRTLVVVAVAGKGLRETRQEFIDLARAVSAVAIRFHTRNPEHLQKGLAGLPIKLVDVRKRLFGRAEYVYKLETL